MNRKKSSMPWGLLTFVVLGLVAGIVYFKTFKSSLIHNIQEPEIDCATRTICPTTTETIKEGGIVCDICNPKDFSDIKNLENPVVIKFYANWCGPCNKLTPIFEKIAEQYKDKIKFYSVNVDTKTLVEQAQKEGLTKENIMYLPTIVFYQKDIVHQQFTGGISESELSEKIKNAFNF